MSSIMEAINNFNVASFLDTFVSLITAFILGSLIGLERQFRQRTAGLRTNVLVAVGAAILWIWRIICMVMPAQSR